MMPSVICDSRGRKGKYLGKGQIASGRGRNTRNWNEIPTVSLADAALVVSAVTLAPLSFPSRTMKAAHNRAVWIGERGCVFRNF